MLFRSVPRIIAEGLSSRRPCEVGAMTKGSTVISVQIEKKVIIVFIARKLTKTYQKETKLFEFF